MKIAVLHGAIINAGDFLIKNRAVALLKYFYPDSEIVEYYRNQSLEEKIPEINTCDILIFAGGPGYCNGFYPRMAPITDDLNKIKIPVMLLGMGWWEHNSDVVSQYSYQFEEPMRALFQKATEKGLKMGCRDIATVNVLRNNGYDNIAMTGCPAWYNLEHIGITRYTGKGLTSCRKICISDCGNMANWGLAVELTQFVRRFFGNCEIYFVCHRGFPDARLGIEPIMKELNVHFMDISGSDEGFKVYDDCDLHIGFRVHAHIYNLSRRNLSILLEEDARGSSLNATLGLPEIKTKYLQVENGALQYHINDKIIYQVEDALLNLAENHYCSMENAYRMMNQYFENMKRHILSIKDII